jgi:hypothetical protein
MTDRVLLGNRGGAYGLWVAKPGVSVSGAGVNDFMLAADQKSLQVIASGMVSSLTSSGATATVTLPVDMGFNPFITVSCQRWRVSWEYLSTTQIRFTATDPRLQAALSPEEVGINRSTDVYWAAMNIPVT